jgi:hypothetical protein
MSIPFVNGGVAFAYLRCCAPKMSFKLLLEIKAAGVCGTKK